jgi:hypothetical protein
MSVMIDILMEDHGVIHETHQEVGQMIEKIMVEMEDTLVQDMIEAMNMTVDTKMIDDFLQGQTIALVEMKMDMIGPDMEKMTETLVMIIIEILEIVVAQEGTILIDMEEEELVEIDLEMKITEVIDMVAQIEMIVGDLEVTVDMEMIEMVTINIMEGMMVIEIEILEEEVNLIKIQPQIKVLKSLKTSKKMILFHKQVTYTNNIILNLNRK